MSIIKVTNLTKEYIINQKQKGLKGAVKGLFFPHKKSIKAVNNVSFEIDSGEVVGYIGPNGAGKSTTIKMLSGILQPTSGSILINNKNPQNERIKIVQNIGVVFGQKTQLYWDIRLGESFELLKRIYKIDDRTYKENLGIMNDLLLINEFIDIPVRQLSLGQRMKGDLTASLLHSPKILFLDEPTIGLDLHSKRNIRQFIKNINRSKKITIILTTHDLSDVQELCSRLMVINNGFVVEDGNIHDIIHRIAPYRYLIIETNDNAKNITNDFLEVQSFEQGKLVIKFDKKKITASELISFLSKEIKIIDLSVKEPDIEDIIDTLYTDD